MATATTTPQVIRERQRDLIAGITPAELPSYQFVQHIEKSIFAEWVEINAATCFRAFAIEDLSPYTSPISGDFESEEVVTQFAVSVAYPISYAYGDDGVNGLADVVETDRLSIERTIGLYSSANYVAGQHSALLVDFEIERTEKTWLATATYEIRFRRSVLLNVVAINRITESGDTRITESGDTRILE